MGLILVSNDDGIQSEGLQALVDALRCIGDVVVVAPDREQSAVSHALTMDRPLRIHGIEPGVYSVDGTPTDCILLGVNRLCGNRAPDLVVSGINKGANLGDDIVYSGTVSAAMEGARLGIPSFAVSLAARRDFLFETAAAFARELACWLVGRAAERPPLLNVNVPNLAPDRIRGVRITRQGKRIYNGAVVEKTDPRGRKYYWIAGDEPSFERVESSDIQAVEAGWISITPLQQDMTDYEALRTLAGSDIGGLLGLQG
jgi:5'-nucleotidase